MGAALEIGPEVLDVGSLLSLASAATGLDDYGDHAFVEPLSRWTDALRAEAGLNASGFTAWHHELLNLLKNRLRIEDDVKRHPEILEEDVSDPIVVLGLPRTGTTKLQRILSADPGVQKLAYWRLINPAPFPGGDPLAPDPRIALAHEQLKGLEHRPEILAAHHAAAEEADEDLLLLELSFECLLALTRSRCPSFVEWWLAQPRQRPYRDLRRSLQYLQWQDGGRQGRPWVLKSPAHLGNLDVVFETFPGATVVHCHRDPVVATGSSMRLMELAYRSRSDEVDVQEIGSSLLTFFADEMRRNLAQRDALSDRSILDVSFADVCDAPLRIAEDVQKVRGGELTAEAVASIESWDEGNPQHKYGRFEYSLDDYGVTREAVEREFAAYLDRFGR